MNTIKEILTDDNNASGSRCLQFIGVKVIGADGKLLNGEQKLSDGTLVRFVDGLIDGHIYDESGNSIEERPALEYEYEGTEYWTHGKPHGYPAVSQAFHTIEEDWENGQIRAIRNEMEIEKIE